MRVEMSSAELQQKVHSILIPDIEISKMINKEVDLTPKAIIERLKLRRPIYQRTAAYGHFGREEDGFNWEILDLVDLFKKYI